MKDPGGAGGGVLDREGFLAVDMRVGRVVAARPNPEARKPALVLEIDFGEALGRRTSSAQITRHYAPEALIGRLVVAVVNFPPLRIAGVRSEVLVLGVTDAEGEVVLLAPDHAVAPGARVH